MDAKTYLQHLQKQMFQSKFGLAYTARCHQDRQDVLGRIKRARSAIEPILPRPPMNDEELLRIAMENNPIAPLEPIASGLMEEVAKITPDKDTVRLEKTVVGFLPTGVLNACCVSGPFDGYVVAINYGLYFTFLLLNLALIGPHVTGDLQYETIEAIYPGDIFKDAVHCALKPSVENYQRIARHLRQVPVEVIGLAAPGLSSMLLYMFLHEIGHIVNGDVDRGCALAIFDPKSHGLKYIGASHRREYAADRYAWKIFLAEPDGPVSAWARFAWIEAIFQFFLRVERRSSQQSKTHPSSASRLRTLRRLMKDQWGEDIAGFTKGIGIDFTLMEHGSLEQSGSTSAS